MEMSCDSLEKDPREPPSEDRSTKKARFREGESQSSNPPVMSFKDKVLQSDRERAGSLAGDFEEFTVSDSDVVVYREGSMPSITFSNRVQEELSKQWKATVIVKLLGRSIGYRSLCNRLESMWNFTQGFDVIDLENDYFLVKLKSGGDVEAVLTGGPWVMLGHYLSVQSWSPKFDCRADRIQKIQAWIRLPGMPIHYYNKKVLRYIGQMVGTVIKIDYCTESAERGKFARIAVELDLSLPLVAQFSLDGKIQMVEYECLPRICFSCGKFGHVKEFCPEIIVKDKPAQGGGEGGQVSQDRPVTTTGGETNPNFGPWMMVSKKGRSTNFQGKKNNYQAENSSKGTNLRGSRFQILERDNDEDLNIPAKDQNVGEEYIDLVPNFQHTIRKVTDRISHAKKDFTAPTGKSDILKDVSNVIGPVNRATGPSNTGKSRYVVNKANTSLNMQNHSAVTVYYTSAKENNNSIPAVSSHGSKDRHSQMLDDPGPPAGNTIKTGELITKSNCGNQDDMNIVEVDSMEEVVETIDVNSSEDVEMHGDDVAQV
ncbi:uncharacterized protein LOC126668126 [Mercurialis annua]|uniref:uncharacterized protein LOC126668126 n=1 Tax=Mercurialis annua TaxID=3986 RepID=UPI00215F54AE|nr:uncharacterized protein LOC126668126 [Mercurialis annua]